MGQRQPDAASHHTHSGATTSTEQRNERSLLISIMRGGWHASMAVRETLRPRTKCWAIAADLLDVLDAPHPRDATSPACSATLLLSLRSAARFTMAQGFRGQSGLGLDWRWQGLRGCCLQQLPGAAASSKCLRCCLCSHRPQEPNLGTPCRTSHPHTRAPPCKQHTSHWWPMRCASMWSCTARDHTAAG